MRLWVSIGGSFWFLKAVQVNIKHDHSIDLSVLSSMVICKIDLMAYTKAGINYPI